MHLSNCGYFIKVKTKLVMSQPVMYLTMTELSSSETYTGLFWDLVRGHFTAHIYIKAVVLLQHCHLSVNKCFVHLRSWPALDFWHCWPPKEKSQYWWARSSRYFSVWMRMQNTKSWLVHQPECVIAQSNVRELTLWRTLGWILITDII